MQIFQVVAVISCVTKKHPRQNNFLFNRERCAYHLSLEYFYKNLNLMKLFQAKYLNTLNGFSYVHTLISSQDFGKYTTKLLRYLDMC